MKQTINLYQFRDAFRDAGRADQFSYKGLELLFESLSDLEDETGDELELDPIAICCDFTECTVEDVANDYSIDTSAAEHANIELSEDIDVSDDYRKTFNKWLLDTFGGESDDDEYKDIVLEYLQDNTFLVGAMDDLGKDTTVIYQSF